MATPIQEAEKLIAAGRTEEALKVLIKVSVVNKWKFLLLQGRLKRLEKKNNLATITANQYEAGINQINNDILSILKYDQGSIKSLLSNAFLWLFTLLLIVVILVRLVYLFSDTNNESSKKTPCPDESKIAVYIADFQEKESDRFSSNLITLLRMKLEPTTYKVGGKGFLSPDFEYYYDTIQYKYFVNECDTSGLFVNGIWDRRDTIFNCYINFINLSIEIPGAIEADKIIIQNPKLITFSLRKDTKYLADVIIAILKVNEGEPFEALNMLVKVEEKLESKDLKGVVSFYKGNAQRALGKDDSAQNSYEAALDFKPDLKPTIIENIQDINIVPKNIPDNIPKDNQNQEANLIPKRNKKNIETKDLVKNNREELFDKDTLWGDTLWITSKKLGMEFKAIKMKDGRIWTASNLNIEIDSSWCYNNDPKNCKKYGRLYTWEAANEACAQLGDGWRLPTDGEWTKMVDQYGGAKFGNAKDEGKAAYQALIEGGSTGFAALLGGSRYSGGSYDYLGTDGFYWTSTEIGSDDAWYYGFGNGKLWRLNYFNYFNYRKTSGRSVRCLQD